MDNDDKFCLYLLLGGLALLIVLVLGGMTLDYTLSTNAMETCVKHGGEWVNDNCMKP